MEALATLSAYCQALNRLAGSKHRGSDRDTVTGAFKWLFGI